MVEMIATQAATNTLGETAPIHQGFIESIRSFVNGNVTQAASALFLQVIIPASIVLLLLIVTYFVAKLISRWICTSMCKRVDQTIGKFAGRVTFYSILAIVGLTILQTAHIDVTGVAAVIAAAGFAIGLAFQGSLSNFAAGILLLVFRPFKVGDMVNTAGVMGKVNEIDLFTTTLDTLDNRRLIIPNSSIAGTTIENITYHKHRRVDVPVGVAYSASLDETRAVLTACAEAMSEKLIRGEGRGYQILLTNLGPHSVEWTVRVWAATENFFAMKEALTTEIKRQLDRNGLEIPFPQMQLHVKDHDRFSATSAAGPHHSLPVPKMNTSSIDIPRPNRTRPRIRGDAAQG